MNYKITNGSVTYGAETILEQIDFEVKDKQKIAIVGRNGCGKSTLLKALTDNEILSEGIGEEKFNIYKEGTINFGYLKQIDFEDENITMLEEILKVYSNIIMLEKKMEDLVLKMQIDSDFGRVEDAKDFAKIQERYEFLGGYLYKKALGIEAPRIQ